MKTENHERSQWGILKNRLRDWINLNEKSVSFFARFSFRQLMLKNMGKTFHSAPLIYDCGFIQNALCVCGETWILTFLSIPLWNRKCQFFNTQKAKNFIDLPNRTWKNVFIFGVFRKFQSFPFFWPKLFSKLINYWFKSFCSLSCQTWVEKQ